MDIDKYIYIYKHGTNKHIYWQKQQNKHNDSVLIHTYLKLKNLYILQIFTNFPNSPGNQLY